MRLPLVRYVLMAALRDRLISSLFLAYVVSGSLSVFLASSALIEQDQFTVIFLSSSLRLVSVLGLVLFVVSFVRRSFDAKDIEFLLSRPVGRIQFILSYAFSFSVLAVFVSAAAGFVLLCISYHLFGIGHILWTISLMFEAVVMVVVAFFFAMQISSSSGAAMVTIGVYVLGRLIGQLLGIIDSVLVDSYGLYSVALQVVSVLTPRLDLLAQSSWLIYDVDIQVFYFSLMQVLGIAFLVLCAACVDFSKKQF